MADAAFEDQFLVLVAVDQDDAEALVVGELGLVRAGGVDHADAAGGRSRREALISREAAGLSRRWWCSGMRQRRRRTSASSGGRSRGSRSGVDGLDLVGPGEEQGVDGASGR